MNITVAAPPVWLVPAAFLGWVVLLRVTRFDTLADDKPGRLAAIEGLRGILALMVYGHHFAIARQFAFTGVWTFVPSNVWTLLGQVGVATFFMITGLLFGQKILRSPEGIRPVGFLLGRVFRLYPVYLTVVLILATLAIAAQGPPPWKAAKTYLHNGFDWLTFGGLQLLGWTEAGRATALVSWSLRYEWIFYLLLPTAAAGWAALRFSPWPLLGLAGIGLILAYWPLTIPVLDVSTNFFAPFLTGACVTVIPPEGRVSAWLRGPGGALLCVAACLLLFGTAGTAYAVSSYLLLVLVFAPIAVGNSLFGVLTWRPMQFLGAISYDVYLLHGLVLFVGFDLLLPHALATPDPLATLTQFFAGGLAVITVSTVVHHVIEIPGQRLGSYLARTGKRERLAAP